MSTGRMQNIYNKMKRQGIDMLMVKSAVKVGGQYSKPVNWDDYAQDGDESNPLNHIGGNIKNPLKLHLMNLLISVHISRSLYTCVSS